MTNRDIAEEIQQHIASDRIVLFMKGDKDFPMCGFSGFVVQVLKNLGQEFTTINVLEDEAIRQGIKTFSSWPTIPQLYIGGTFVGGADIVREMFESGELKEMMRAA